MLKELRGAYNCSGKSFLTKEATRGLCSNKDCYQEATKACTVCGIRYCSSDCQKEDWKLRHKRFCKPTDIHRTKVTFAIYKTRVNDYANGKSSFDRYYAIANWKVYKEIYDLDDMEYCSHISDPVSGRILTIVGDGEKAPYQTGATGARAIPRGKLLYLANEHLAGPRLVMTTKGPLEATELVPLNRDFQQAFTEAIELLIRKEMRTAFHIDREVYVAPIAFLVCPVAGRMFGNPILLSLESTLAYKDYFEKVEIARQPKFLFAFALLCSILFPDFKLSMVTGNPEDDDRVIGEAWGEDSPGDTLNFTHKAFSQPPPEQFRSMYAEVFEETLIAREQQEHDAALVAIEGEPRESEERRWVAYDSKYYWWKWSDLDIRLDCSESLVLLPLEQTAFPVPEETAVGTEAIGEGQEVAVDAEGGTMCDE